MNKYQKTQKYSKQRGFTLLEILLAMAIFTLVSLASFSVFDTVSKSDQLAKEKLGQINQLQTMFLLMERDFSQIARRFVRLDGNESSKNFIHSQDLSFSSQSGAVAFVRHGWTNPNLVIGRSSLQSVAYRVEEGLLQRLYFNHVDAQLGDEPKVRVLMSDVESIEFKYFYQGKWQDKLPQEILPDAIEVIVISEVLGEISRKFLVAGEGGSKND